MLPSGRLPRHRAPTRPQIPGLELYLLPCSLHGRPASRPAGQAAGGGPSGARKLTSHCEPAVDLGVDFLVPQVASDLLHRLSDDGDSQYEALGKRRERV